MHARAVLKNGWLRSPGVALAFALAGCGSVSPEPANLYPLKQEIRGYVDSGRYERDIAGIATQAKTWIEQRAAQRDGPGKVAGGRLAVVFDLDETLMSNWPHLSAHDFGYVASEWNAWVEAAKAPAIEPVREVYRAAQRMGIDVIFLTGRRERDRAATEQNLRWIDCGDYAVLICQPDTAKATTGEFKRAQRERLSREGRVIIANIGDQASDLAGGFAERTFKLPDPFYLTE